MCQEIVKWCGIVVATLVAGLMSWGAGSVARPDGENPVKADSTFPALRLLAVDEEGKPRNANRIKELAKEAKAADATDIYILSHGWNTGAAEAGPEYESRLQVTQKVAAEYAKLRPNPYKPFLIGIVWPSKAWDSGAAAEGAGEVSLTPANIAALEESFPRNKVKASERAADLKTITELAEKKKAELTPADRSTAYKLFRKYSIDPAKMKYPEDIDSNNLFDGPVPEGATLPEGALPSIGDMARVFTFWQMKKRAGIVGENGVASLLGELASATQARLHLFGHSFGSKVVLSAALVHSKKPQARKVNTVVLLQGAISYQAFARQVTGINPPRPGGYRQVLKAVKGPIIATFSKNDKELNRYYPLGAGWARQRGELEAGPGKYSALGAVGFDGEPPTDMKAVGIDYRFTDEPKLYSIKASAYIPGHSDISDPAVAWLEWAAIVRK